MAEGSLVVTILKWLFEKVFATLEVLYEALVWLIGFIVRWAYTLFAACMLFLACCVPMQLPYVLASYREIAKDHHLGRSDEKKYLLALRKRFVWALWSWHLFLALLDLVTYPLVLIFIAMPWRLMSLRTRLSKCNENIARVTEKCKKDRSTLSSPTMALWCWKQRFDCMWAEILLMFLDILFVPFGAVVLVTAYRLPSLFETWREKGDKWSPWQRRAIVIKYCGLILLELPVFTLGVVVMCTWRGPALWAVLRFKWGQTGQANSKKPSRESYIDDLVSEILSQALGLFFGDLFVLPVAPFALLTWRLGYLRNQFDLMCQVNYTDGRYISRKRGERRPLRKGMPWGDGAFYNNLRGMIYEQAKIGIWDTLTIFAMGLVSFTWRGSSCWRSVFAIRKQHCKGNFDNQLFGDNAQVWVQLLAFFIDIPFVCMGIVVTLTAVRTRVLFRNLGTCSSASSRRIVCYRQTLLLLMDALLLPVGALIVLTTWRIKSARQGVTRVTSEVDEIHLLRARRKLEVAIIKERLAKVFLAGIMQRCEDGMYSPSGASYGPTALATLQRNRVPEACGKYSPTGHRYGPVSRALPPEFGRPSCQSMAVWRRYQNMTIGRHYTLAKYLTVSPEAEAEQRLETNPPVRGKDWCFERDMASRTWIAVEEIRLLLDLILLLPAALLFATRWRFKTARKKALKSAAQGSLFGPHAKVAKQFAMLLLDFAVLPLLLIVLLSGLRARALFSALASAGKNMRKMFAVIVVGEFLRLLVDIPFALAAVVLVLLRPLDAPRMLLEDKRHCRWRLLEFHRRFLPDIALSRAQAYDEASLTVSHRLKHVKPARDKSGRRLQSKRLGKKIDAILRRTLIQPLTVHLERTKDLDREYTHRVQEIIHFEKQRRESLMRLFKAEMAYQSTPNTDVRRSNIMRVHLEAHTLQHAVDSAYARALDMVPPKPPLYDKINGFEQRTRSQTQDVIINIATSGYFVFTALLLLCALPVYRLPSLLRQIFRRPYDREGIVMRGILEYVKDAIALAQAICVILTLYRAPSLGNWIVIDLVQSRSWSLARDHIALHFQYVGSDILELVAMAFKWSTYRYFILATLWGWLAPLDIFAAIGSKLAGGVLWAAGTALPFIFAFYLMPLSPADSTYALWIMAFSGVLWIVLALSAVRLSRGKQAKMRPFRFMRLTWSNTLFIFGELLAFLQLSALTLLPFNLPLPGSEVLRATAEAVLLDSWVSYDAMFWISLAFFAAWYFVASAPPLLEEVISSNEINKGDISNVLSWKLLMSLLSTTLLVTVSGGFFHTLSCAWTVGDASASGVALPETCWTESNHNRSYYAPLAMYALMWYLSTSVVYSVKYQDSGTFRVDLAWSSGYATLTQLVELLLVGIAVMMPGHPYIVASFQFAMPLLLAFVTLAPKSILPPVGNSIVLMRVRATMLTAVSWLGLCVLVALQQDDPTSFVPIYMLAGGWGLGLLLVVAFIIMGIKTQSEEEVLRARVRTRLLELESLLSDSGRLGPMWKQARKNWRWVVKHAISAAEHQKQEDYDRSRDRDQDTLVTAVVVPCDREICGTPPPPYPGMEEGEPSTSGILSATGNAGRVIDISANLRVLEEHGLIYSPGASDTDKSSNGERRHSVIELVASSEDSGDNEFGFGRMDRRQSIIALDNIKPTRRASAPTYKGPGPPQAAPRQVETLLDDAPEGEGTRSSSPPPPCYEAATRIEDMRPGIREERLTSGRILPDVTFGARAWSTGDDMTAGRALLILLDHVPYDELSLAFLYNLSRFWRLTSDSDWYSIAAAVDTVLNALVTPYTLQQAPIPTSEMHDVLKPSMPLAPFPGGDFVPDPTDPAELAARSAAVRADFITLCRCISGTEIATLMDAILPHNGLARLEITYDGDGDPYKVVRDSDDSASSGGGGAYLTRISPNGATLHDQGRASTLPRMYRFSLELVESAHGRITATGEDGFSAAMGATLQLEERLTGTMYPCEICFSPNCFKGNKFLTISVEKLFYSDHKLRVNNKYSASYAKVLATPSEITWQ